MRLWIFSDLHQEIGTVNKFPEKRPDADLAVMAGDWTHADKIEETAKAFIKLFRCLWSTSLAITNSTTV